MSPILTFCMVYVAAAGAEPQPSNRMIPFVVPVIDSWDNVTNLSWLNEKPAGKHGFVAAKDGHFVDGSGKRIRFIGGAFCHGASFPTHEMADRVAARLAMTGLNLVRLHHMDGRTKPNGIWRIDDRGVPRIDEEQLDRLDYLIHQLKRHGVYANINLKVSRTFREVEGCPNARELGRFSKGPDYFDPRMIELQKQYARDLLRHTNPYTKTRYVDDPALAFVEINNENSLLHLTLLGKLGVLPAHYDRQLTGRWNGWLEERYKTTAALKEAWHAGDEPLGDNLLTNGDFAQGMEAWRFSVRDPKQGTASTGDGGPSGLPCLHVKAIRPGKLPWTFQTHQVHLDLQHDKLYTLSFWMKAGKPTTVQLCVRLDHPCRKTKRFRIVGLNRPLRAPTEWQRYQFVFRANDPVKDGSRVGFTFPNAPGDYWIADMQLRPGGMLGLRSSEDISLGTVVRPAAASADPKRDPRWLDYIRFISEIDQAYALDMYRFLKRDLGVKSLVIDSQASYGGIGGIYRESQLDYIDMHAYWDHPRFPRKSWDMRDWLVHNTPMVASPEGGTILRFACHRVHGKPFVVSEFNQASPNEFAAECWPLMAACAAVQDWDGIIVHNYVNYTHEGWAEPRIRNFFDTAAHPAKMPLLLSAAMMFRRGDVRPADSSATLAVPVGSVPSLTAALGRSPQARTLWEDAGLQPSMLTGSRLAMAFVPGSGVPTMSSSGQKPSQIRWEPASESSAIFTVDSPATKAIVGMVAKRTVTLGPWTMQFGESSNDFVVATLTAIDGKPVGQASSLVLTVVGKATNTAAEWQSEQAMLSSWGRAPTLAEAVPARVALRSSVPNMSVYALDGKGERIDKIPSESASGHITFRTGPESQTVWYELHAGG